MTKKITIAAAIMFAASCAVFAQATNTVRLDNFQNGQPTGWVLTDSHKIGAAKESLSVTSDGPGNTNALKLTGDYSAGGEPITLSANIDEFDGGDVRAVHARVRSSNTALLTIGLVDRFAQTHLRDNYPITPDGQWHDIVITPADVANGTHSGGVNDGVWRGPITGISITISQASAPLDLQPVVQIADIYTDTAPLPVPTLLPASVSPSAVQPGGPIKVTYNWIAQPFPRNDMVPVWA